MLLIRAKSVAPMSVASSPASPSSPTLRAGTPRHAAAFLGLDTHGRIRQERLVEVTEKVGEVINGGENYA